MSDESKQLSDGQLTPDKNDEPETPEVSEVASLEQSEAPHPPSKSQSPTPPKPQAADYTPGILKEDLGDDVNLLSDEEGYEGDTETAQQLDATPPPVPPPKGQKFTLSGTLAEVYISDVHRQLKTNGSARIVVLLTNSLGLASANNLRLADQYSEKLKCAVIVPDLFDKDPIKTSGAEVPESQLVSQNKISLSLTNIKSWAINAVKGFMDEMWLARHTFEHTYPLITNVLAEIIQIYRPISLVLVGYSFGARYVFRLLEDRNNDAWSSEEDVVTAGVAINPTLASLDDFRTAAKPVFLVYSQDDELLRQPLIDLAVSIWKNKDVEHSTLACGNSSTGQPLPHGFAVPRDYPESVVGDWPLQVTDKVSQWVQEHLD